MVKERPLYKKNAVLLAEMIRHGYSLKSLAKAAEVHYLTVWRIVNQEHRPTFATARKIAQLLDTTPEALHLEPWGPDHGPEET